MPSQGCRLKPPSGQQTDRCVSRHWPDCHHRRRPRHRHGRRSNSRIGLQSGHRPWTCPPAAALPGTYGPCCPLRVSYLAPSPHRSTTRWLARVDSGLARVHLPCLRRGKHGKHAQGRLASLPCPGAFSMLVNKNCWLANKHLPCLPLCLAQRHDQPPFATAFSRPVSPLGRWHGSATWCQHPPTSRHLALPKHPLSCWLQETRGEQPGASHLLSSPWFRV